MPSYELPKSFDGKLDINRIRHDLDGSIESAEEAFRAITKSPSDQPACNELFEVSKNRLNEILERLLTYLKGDEANGR